MEVRRQRCQACQSIEHINLLVREAGEPQVVLVRCARCRSLVARYKLAAYYHHGKGFESWVGSFRGAAESGRDLLQTFEEVKRRAEDQFKAVVAYLVAAGKDD
jgi:hypothetical protein